MRKLIILFLLLFVEETNAQVTFYVAPVINLKGHYRSNFVNRFYDKTTYVNEYFEYQSRRMIFSSLGLGIKGGVSLNNRWLFEFGWSQDETRSGNKTYATLFRDYTTLLGYNTYSPVIFNSIYWGVQTNRFTLSAQYKLINPEKFKQKSFWMVPYINIGLGLNLSTFKEPKYQFLKFEEYPALIDDNIALTHNQFMHVGQRKNIHGQIGLSSDFMFKKKYLFSFSVFSTFTAKARKMNRDLSTSSTSIYIDNGTDVKEYYFSEGSRGTGLYFEISRRFQLYPWIKSKKKLEREENKL